MKHELTLTLPPQPVYLNADPARLAQAVGNLLINACKFTARAGHIWLSVAVADREGQQPQAVIRVRDTGIGIAADQIPRIFELFTQVDMSLERVHGGLGVGLALVKRLIEMHEGTVEARSAGPGLGSEFIVQLPVLSEPFSAASPPQPGSRTAPLARRILVVDDNRDSADSLALLLRLSGHDIHTVYDGVAAVTAAAQLQPDVILLDIGLPGLNGYDAARQIRERRGRDVLLGALTGWGQEEDRSRSELAGFDAHLVKPVDYAELTRLLTELSTG
jgi:CheY-like chemotaxis protein